MFRVGHSTPRVEAAPIDGNDGVQPDAVVGGGRRDRGGERAPGLRFGSWNVGSMRRRDGEFADILRSRRVGVCCVQEVRWKGGSSCWLGNVGSRYKFLWQGTDDSSNGVGVLVAEEWADCIQSVLRVSDRLMVVKLVVGKRLFNFISAYAPQVGRSTEEKDLFWNSMHDLVGAIPESEGVVIGGDLNGHVGAVQRGMVLKGCMEVWATGPGMPRGSPSWSLGLLLSWRCATRSSGRRRTT